AQTAESTHATSAAIAKLAELSAGLRKAAAGFRLPGSQPANAEPAAGAAGFKRTDETRSAATLRPGASHASHALGGT
ncbi:hypothetical protein, partial [Streptomyces galilaeus]|uniref:hypothetical protein n=1 Tax=Streptomyces galilaeus TaxID=33899 RepID=UPI0038F7FCBF